ncbi:MAG TPA: hypothetical protein DCS93_26505 [Microscillaceae bacterium]|nr:hypothetical protein [Microscillaceae bacterium]
MTTQEIADKYIAYNREGKSMQALKELFADDAYDLEPKGAPVERTEGKEALIKKHEQFEQMVEEMHGMSISDPIVADNFFSCSMAMDVTYKGMGRAQVEEICLYEVKDGKIVSSQFFFTPPPMG